MAILFYLCFFFFFFYFLFIKVFSFFYGFRSTFFGHLKNAENMPEETSKAFFAQIAEKNQLRSVRFHSEFFKDMKTDWSQVMIVLGLAGIIGLGAWVVIQSIFRISINDKIKSYGQLRTIGATKKQIKRIVKKERNQLGVLGSIIGMILANCN